MTIDDTQAQRAGGPRGPARRVAALVTAAVLVMCGAAAGVAQAQTTTPPPEVTQPVWPYASSTTRYASPEAAALGFAVDFLGMAEPEVGEFRQGDSRSGEIDISAGLPLLTTLLVRQLTADDSWWVLGSSVETIEVDEPEAAATISSPVTVSGRASAFEGNVPVEVRQDGSTTPIGTGFVTGNGGPELGPFEGEITFSPSTQSYGALLFLVTDAKDGGVAGAHVQRAQFSPAPATTTTTTTSSTTVSSSETSTTRPTTTTTAPAGSSAVKATPNYTG